MYIVRMSQKDDAAAILMIQNQGWMDTYEPILGSEKIAAINEKRTIQQWQEIIEQSHTCTFVIENEKHQIVGFAGCGPNREEMPGYPGELYAIYILKEYHRTGYGKALFQATAEYLQSHQLTPFVVWVFKDNPACCFYEKAGGQFIKDGPSHTDPSISQHCYGFAI